MQQQPSRSQPPRSTPPSKQPLNAITTEQIQKHLEDNKNLILAILEYQKLGKFQECAQYQTVLQNNLMYLAAIADAQTPTPTSTVTPQESNPPQVMQMPPISIPQASSFMQQAPQQPGGGGGGQKPPFQLNSIHGQDQQQPLAHFQQQQQQQLQAQMRLRAGGQSGLFGMQPALAANPGGRQGGPEASYGGRSMFGDYGGFGNS